MKSNNLLIGHKHGKEIFLIERFITCDYLWVQAGARLDVDEKNIIFRSVTFQNVVENPYNADLVTHMQVDLPWKLKSAR
jgi:hypothetical protein